MQQSVNEIKRVCTNIWILQIESKHLKQSRTRLLNLGANMSTIDTTKLTEYPTKATQFYLEPIINFVSWWVQVPRDTPSYSKINNEDGDDNNNNNNNNNNKRKKKKKKKK